LGSAVQWARLCLSKGYVLLSAMFTIATDRIMTARITPARAPFPPAVQAWLDLTMPAGEPPLVLFTTLARDPRLFQKFFSAGLLDRGNLTLRQREIVIDRVTALCKSEYEWGVHIARFASRVRLDDRQIQSLAHGAPDDPCWSTQERALLRTCDALHSECTLDEKTWQILRVHFSEQAILELLMLCGFYRTVSYLTNALRLPAEPGAAAFPPVDDSVRLL
jgi:alkylhydroperoxidase family enzyme